MRTGSGKETFMKDTDIPERNKKLPVIGVYTFCSTGSVLVHEIEDDRVRASINGRHPEWKEITEEWNEENVEWEPGFYMHPGFFVPFSEVLRTDL